MTNRTMGTHVVMQTVKAMLGGALMLAASTVTFDSAAQAQDTRPARIGGHPNLNGIWQALNTADWNLEAHSSEQLEEFWRLGALGAIPGGQGVVEGGEIPYRPEALAKRASNKAQWPAADPVTKCFMPGIPRATYLPFPWEIVQGEGDMLFVYSFATTNRTIYMDKADHVTADELPTTQMMGWSNGRWEGDTLVIEVVGHDPRTWFDRAGNYHSDKLKVTERYTPINADHMRYEATIEDPEVYTRPWKITMPLYRNIEPNAELLEYKCMIFSEDLIYGQLYKDPPK